MATRFLTEAELRADYGDAVITKLADRDNNGSADAGIIETAILDAEDEALSFLRGYTDVPATPETTSRRLKVLIGQLAYYNLYRHMATTPFRARDGREIALKGLSQIRSGELSIATADAPTVDLARPAVAVRRRSQTLGDQPITLESMRDWGHR
jgi:phage gp36-like protein